MTSELIIIYADGSGSGTIGIVFSHNGVQKRFTVKFDDQTHNESEWRALWMAVKLARRYRWKNILVKMDSELVVKQFNGEYKLRNSRMRGWYMRVTRLIKSFGMKVQVEWVPRKENLAGILLEAIT